MPGLQLHLFVLVEILEWKATGQSQQLAFPVWTICHSHFYLCVEQESPEVLLKAVLCEKEVDSDLVDLNLILITVLLVAAFVCLQSIQAQVGLSLLLDLIKVDLHLHILLILTHLPVLFNISLAVVSSDGVRDCIV